MMFSEQGGLSRYNMSSSIKTNMAFDTNGKAAVLRQTLRLNFKLFTRSLMAFSLECWKAAEWEKVSPGTSNFTLQIRSTPDTLNRQVSVTVVICFIISH